VPQVTNASEKTAELRALASAGDASKLWDLRCVIRERLITFLQETYPESLPKIRTVMNPAPVFAASPPREKMDNGIGGNPMAHRMD